MSHLLRIELYLKQSGLVAKEHDAQHLPGCFGIFHATVIANLFAIRTIRPKLIDVATHVALLVGFSLDKGNVVDSFRHLEHLYLRRTEVVSLQVPLLHLSSELLPLEMDRSILRSVAMLCTEDLPNLLVRLSDAAIHYVPFF